MVSFEIFVKAMPPSLSELKVLPSFCFAFKIPDDRAVTKTYMHFACLVIIGGKPWVYNDFITLGYKICLFCFKMSGNQIFWMNCINWFMLKLIIYSPIVAKGYKKLIFETLLLSPPLEHCALHQYLLGSEKYI